MFSFLFNFTKHKYAKSTSVKIFLLWLAIINSKL